MSYLKQGLKIVLAFIIIENFGGCQLNSVAGFKDLPVLYLKKVVKNDTIDIFYYIGKTDIPQSRLTYNLRDSTLSAQLYKFKLGNNQQPIELKLRMKSPHLDKFMESTFQYSYTINGFTSEVIQRDSIYGDYTTMLSKRFTVTYNSRGLAESQIINDYYNVSKKKYEPYPITISEFHFEYKDEGRTAQVKRSIKFENGQINTDEGTYYYKNSNPFYGKPYYLRSFDCTMIGPKLVEKSTVSTPLNFSYTFNVLNPNYPDVKELNGQVYEKYDYYIYK